MRKEFERLLDIKDAILKIQKYAARGKSVFEKEELVQTWIIHHLQVIGEASSQLPEGFRNRHSSIPWSKIIGMRNILVHRYFGIDTSLVWQAIEVDLPILLETVDAILRGEQGLPEENSTT